MMKENKTNFDKSPNVCTEIKLSGLVAVKNVSFLFGEDFTGFIKQTITDSEIKKGVLLDRKKIRNIVVDVIAPEQQIRLAKFLRSDKFSMLVDESTDITTHHSICIVVRYFDYEQRKTCDFFVGFGRNPRRRRACFSQC